MDRREYLIFALERNPGATEALIRSGLRSEFGDSTTLDEAIMEGAVIRRKNKLYRREDAP